MAEDNDDEQKTPDAVEVAQGSVDDGYRSLSPGLRANAVSDPENEWQHTRLQDAASPWGDQIDMWQSSDSVALRTVDYADVKTIRLDAAAIEKLVDAWLARHPRAALEI